MVIILKENLINVLVNIKNQLILANETVEYTSWLTASIFSVLSVFTIFLSHQYQNHTAELKKIVWKMRNNIKKKDSNEFEQNVVDFEYLSKTPKVLMKAVRTSIIVLYALVPVWFVSGLSTLLFILNQEGATHYLSLLLTVIVTSLFIFFSIRLASILNQLSDTEEDDKISTIKDLFNVKHLVEKNFNIQKLLEMNNTKWNFLLSGSEPYTKVKIDSEYGIYNFSLLLHVETTTGNEMYISTPINLQANGTFPEELQLDLTEQHRRDIQRFFYLDTFEHMTVTQVVFLEGTYYYFKGKIIKNGDLVIVNKIEPRNKIDLPTEIKQGLEDNTQSVYISNLI